MDQQECAPPTMPTPANDLKHHWGDWIFVGCFEMAPDYETRSCQRCGVTERRSPEGDVA